MTRIDDTMELLVATLKDIDSEASSVVEGYPTGLRWLHGHLLGRTRTKDRTEDLWADALAARLAGTSTIIDARTRVAYPAPVREIGDGVSRGSCDLVLELRDGARAWIEIKGAWTYLRDVSEPARLKPNRVWRKHLTSPREGAARDFLKLAPMVPAEAEHAGVLLVAFDIEGDRHYAIGEDAWELMKVNGEVTSSGWKEVASRTWHDEHQIRQFGLDERLYRVTLRAWRRVAT